MKNKRLKNLITVSPVSETENNEPNPIYIFDEFRADELKIARKK